MKLAPIVLFTYNRPLHTQKTIEALSKNIYAADSELIVYSDAPKNESAVKSVNQVREYLKNIIGFKSIEIIERSENWGLANSIIDGVTSMLDKYGRVIVLEDDLITSPFFLKYMNESLELYEKDDSVISIHGYIYPIKHKLPDTFFIKGADCWGWATWSRGWRLFSSNGEKLYEEIKRRNLVSEFNFDNSYPYFKMLKHQIEGKNNSWAIRWYASAFLENKLTLYPGYSLINQIGTDGSGTHCMNNDVYETQLSLSPIHVEKIEIKESLIAKKEMIRYFKYTMKISKLKSYIRHLFK